MEAHPTNNMQIAQDTPRPIANPFTLNLSILPPHGSSLSLTLFLSTLFVILKTSCPVKCSQLLPHAKLGIGEWIMSSK